MESQIHYKNVVIQIREAASQSGLRSYSYQSFSSDGYKVDGGQTEPYNPDRDNLIEKAKRGIDALLSMKLIDEAGIRLTTRLS